MFEDIQRHSTAFSLEVGRPVVLQLGGPTKAQLMTGRANEGDVNVRLYSPKTRRHYGFMLRHTGDVEDWPTWLRRNLHHLPSGEIPIATMAKIREFALETSKAGDLCGMFCKVEREPRDFNDLIKDIERDWVKERKEELQQQAEQVSSQQ